MSNRDAFRITRRQMLASTAAALGSAAVGSLGFPRLAHADLPLPAGRAFLFCYFPGAWDQLLLLDPRDPAVFTPARINDTLIDPRYGTLDGVNGLGSQLVRPALGGPIVFGPGMQRVAPGADRFRISDYAHRMTVVRGLDMAALGHEVGYRYFLTATYPAGTAARGTSIATEIVAQMAPRRLVPNLAFQVESYNDRYPGSVSAMQLQGIDDLLLVLSAPTVGEDPDIERAIEDRGQLVGPCDMESYNRRGLYDAMRGTRAAANEVVRNRVASQFDFVTADTPGAASIRGHYGIRQGVSDSPAVRAAIAAQSIKVGLSQVVSVRIGDVCDTHYVGNAPHMNIVYPGLEALAALLADLDGSTHPDGGSFLDHTTLLVFSEFSRAALFNSFNGRDHHFAGSCMLIGAGIRGNTVVGATSDLGMAPQRWDPSFVPAHPGDLGGLQGSNVEVLKPEHIAATLLASAGLDTSRYQERPLRAALA